MFIVKTRYIPCGQVDWLLNWLIIFMKVNLTKTEMEMYINHITNSSMSVHMNEVSYTYVDRDY